MCAITSPFYWFPRRVPFSGGIITGPMIAGIIFSMRGVTLQLPRSAFLAAQAILGCMIAQNLTGSILTTLAVNSPNCVSYFTGDVAFQRYRGMATGAL